MDKNGLNTNILPYLSPDIKRIISNLGNEHYNKINEIRLTVGQPLILNLNGSKYYAGENGISFDGQGVYTVESNDIMICMELITRSSFYKYNQNINEGYITLPGGNRVGIVGSCSLSENKINSVTDIHSLNYRISHERKFSSRILFDDLFNKGNIKNTLIIAPPGAGKTTILRDIAFLMSEPGLTGKIINCAIIDERFEIASAFKDKMQLDAGKNNFAISGCLKSIAIPMVIRSMAPDVIITDELANADDFDAIKYAKSSGTKVIASVHGYSHVENEIAKFNYENIFEYIVVLSSMPTPGTIKKIIEVK